MLVLTVNGSDTETKTGYITVYSNPTVDLGVDVAICDGTTQTLDAGAGASNYLWSTGATTQTIDVTTAGTYSVMVGNGTQANTNSLDFDGTDDFINLGTNLNSIFSANTWSISTYLYYNSNTGFDAFFSSGWPVQMYLNGNKIEIYLSSDNSNNYLPGANGFTSNTTLTNNTWYNIVFTRDGNNNKIYINGVLDATSVSSGNVATTTGSVPVEIGSIGGSWTAPSYYFDGRIDQLGLWSSALSQQELQNYMSTPPTGNETGLVGYWNFNEGSGSIVTDLTSNGNNGSINGASWSTDAPAQYANNCTATDDIVVSVSPNPTVSAGADQTICAGASVTLSGSGAATYTWNNGVTNGLAFTPSFNSGNISLPWGPTTVNQSTENITIEPSQLVTININHSDVHNTGYASDGIKQAYIKYTYADGTVDEFRFHGNGGIKLYDPTTSTFSTNTYTVGVHSSDFMNIANTAKQYYVECTSVSGSNSWIFKSLNTGLVDIELHENSPWTGLNSVSITESSNFTYTVTGTDANGCTGTDDVVITVNPSPTVDLGVDVAICDGTTQTLDAGAGASNYLWSTGETTQTIDITTAGIYFVTVQDALGCEASDTLIATEKTLAVDAGIDQTICVGKFCDTNC